MRNLKMFSVLRFILFYFVLFMFLIVLRNFAFYCFNYTHTHKHTNTQTNNKKVEFYFNARKIYKCMVITGIIVRILERNTDSVRHG